MNYKITCEENPASEDLHTLSQGLNEQVEALFPGRSRKYVAFFMRDDSGKIVGGVNGNYGSFGWLYVDALWVREDMRGQGLGAELMRRIENEALKHSCKNVFLNT